MKHVRRTYKGETKQHPIYPLAEFDREDVDEVIYWKQADKAGQWVRTDDDYVCEVLGVNGPYKRSSGKGQTIQLVLPFCRMFVNDAASINFEEFYGKGNYNSMSPTSWIEDELKRKRTVRVIRLYASILLKKGRVDEATMKRLGKLYRPNQELPGATFKRLLKKKKTKQMVQDELHRLLSENDVTPDEVIKGYKKTLEKAYKAQQLGVAKGIWDNFRDMLDMMPQKGSSNKLTDGGADEDLIGMLEAEKTEIDVLGDDHDADLLEEVSVEPAPEVPDGES